jgi:hypothetical protein
MDEIEVPTHYHRVRRGKDDPFEFTQELLCTAMVGRAVYHNEAPLHLVVALVYRGPQKEGSHPPFTNLEALVSKAQKETAGVPIPW